MSIAIAETVAREQQPASAAELAGRIPVPVRLPARYDGQPIRHLSPSSYGLWVMCREAWRRKYICGEREAPSGAMFLGSRVDDAVSLYYRRIIDEHERLDLEQVKDAYRALWQTELDAEYEKLGVNWADIHQQAAFELGLEALELTFEQLVPTPRRAGRGPATAGVRARARTASGRSSATSTSRRADVR